MFVDLSGAVTAKTSIPEYKYTFTFLGRYEESLSIGSTCTLYEPEAPAASRPM